MTTKTPKKTRTGTKITGLIAVVALVFAGWTGLWFYVASVLQSEIESHLASRHPDDPSISCKDLSIRGFPFRLSAHCQSVDMIFEQEQARIKGEALFAIAQIYAPRHILFEAQGPFEIESPLYRASLIANWTRFQGSLRFSDKRIERLSVVIADPDVRFTTENEIRSLIRSNSLEFHARPTPDIPDGSNDIDLALSAQAINAQTPLPPLSGTELMVRAQIKAAPELPAGSLPQILKIWHEAGGRLEVTKGSLSDKSALADLTGTFFLTPDLTLNGRGTLFTAITGPGTSALTQMAALLTFLGAGADRDGQAGTEAEFRIENDRIRLESLDLGPAPRLFR